MDKIHVVVAFFSVFFYDITSGSFTERSLQGFNSMSQVLEGFCNQCTLAWNVCLVFTVKIKAPIILVIRTFWTCEMGCTSPLSLHYLLFWEWGSSVPAGENEFSKITNFLNGRSETMLCQKMNFTIPCDSLILPSQSQVEYEVENSFDHSL